MKQNIFEELKQKKQQLLEKAEKAKLYGWMTEQAYQDLVEKIKNDVLIIGVIGQMKCGKSTFLNAFVFEDDVLPAATTPMTAALSVITYGEQKKVVAEFYTQDEWTEQQMQAARSLDEVRGNALEESKIKAAQELVSRSVALGNRLSQLLGNTQEDSFDNLIEYVGAEGKYVSITKSVTIHYPKEYLKGVQIVDTPGFNDPIVSREERTKAFLSKADAVLLMLYAGRPFDETDRDILFKNVAQCGMGRVLIGINKYDIPYENGETEAEIKEYVIKEIQKACAEKGNDILNEIVKETPPITLSAEMALLSQLSMTKIQANDAYAHAWRRSCDIFEVSSQPAMAAKSLFSNLTEAIREVITKEKERILFAKPVNALRAAGATQQQQIEQKLLMNTELIKQLTMPDVELEERYSQLQKLERRSNKKIEGFEVDVDETFTELIRKTKYDMENAVSATCDRAIHVVDNKGFFRRVESVKPEINRLFDVLKRQTLARLLDDIDNKGKRKLLGCTAEFFEEMEDILGKYAPDIDEKDLLRVLKSKINLSIDSGSLFSREDVPEDFSLIDVLVFSVPVLGPLLENFFRSAEKLKETINEIARDFDPREFLEGIQEKKEGIVKELRASVVEEMIVPLQEQLEDVIKNKNSREQKLKEAQELEPTLKQQLSEVKQQMQEIEML